MKLRISFILSLGVLCLGWMVAPGPAQPRQPIPIKPSDPPGKRILGVREQLRAGTLTAEQAWGLGLLDERELLYLLDNFWFPSKDRIALAKVLVAHGDELLRDTSKIGPRAKLALAEYYRSVLDPRLVPIAKEILAAIRQPVPDEANDRVPVVNLLASYHVEKGELEKALDVYLQAPRYSLDREYLAAHVLHAARIYKQLGNVEKAQELYEQVPQYGFAWATGTARHDQAQELIAQGRHEEARKLLQEPVSGLYEDQVKVGMLALLGYSHYRTGEFETARQYSQKAIAQYKVLKNPMQGEGLEGQVSMAQAILSWIERWAREPVIVAPQRLRVVVNRDERDKPVTRRLFVRVPYPVPLTATTDSPQVVARLSDDWRMDGVDALAAPPAYYIEKEVMVEIAPQALGKVSAATLLVSSAAHPDFKVRVPMQIEVQKPTE